MVERRFTHPPLIAGAELGVRWWSLIFAGTLTIALVARPATAGVQTGCCLAFCNQKGQTDCAVQVPFDTVCQGACDTLCALRGGCSGFTLHKCPEGQVRIDTDCGGVDVCGPTCVTFTPTRTETPTPPTSTPTATKVPEGGTCMETAQCETGLRCLEGTCVRLSVTPATSRSGFLVALAVLATVAGLTLRKTARGRKSSRED